MNHILSLIFSSFAWRSLAKALVFAVLALSISACDVLDDDDDDDDDPVVSDNSDPTANAGADQEAEEGDEVTLDGSGSSDSDGTIEKYAWSHVTSNAGVTLSGADTATVTFTAPPVDEDTEMVFRLTVTDDDGATATDDVSVNVLDVQPSSQVLFASQYELKDGATSEPYVNSHEGGDVYGFSAGFTYAWAPDANGMRERQLYGSQYYHTAANIDSNSYFGLTIKAPGNGHVDISESDTLVIQMGEGTGGATAHTTFTIDLNGGEQDSSTFAWSHSCSYDQELLAGSQPGDQLDPPEAWDNGWGVQTYRIPLSDFECGDDNFAELKADLEEVAVKVVGGKDVDASAAADNHTLLQFGYVGFSNDTDPVPGDGESDHILFASQYELKDGATSEPYVNSQENGDVYGFSAGFTYAWAPDANGMRERQLYGSQYYHTAANIDSNSYFGLTIKAPGNGHVDISESDTLVIQMGEGTGGATAHTTFTVDLNGGEQDSTTFAWSHSCSYDQELLAGSQPGDQLDPPEAWDNGWGVQTYRIPLSDFECGDDNFAELKADLEEVAVKVVGGKDVDASAAADNHTLLQFGYVAFAADEDE